MKVLVRLGIRKDPIPVTPVAHYMIGGVTTDLGGRTTVPGLYAIGEVARTGVHGANRLASNSLLECAVFSIETAQSILWDQQNISSAWQKSLKPDLPRNDVKIAEPTHVDRGILRKMMWENVGLVRDRNSLMETLEELEHEPFTFDEPYTLNGFELFAMKNLARLIAMSALQREESRGSHYRSDFPERSDSFLYPIKRIYQRDKLFYT